MATASDAPSLDCAYKLEEYAGVARRKKSTGKETWPGRKQVCRQYREDGVFSADMITLEGDGAQGKPLIKKVMTGGKRKDSPLPLKEIRRNFAAELATFPPALRGLDKTPPYNAQVSRQLEQLAGEVDTRNDRATEQGTDGRLSFH